MRRWIKLTAVIAVFAIVAAACGGTSGTTETTSEPTFKACEVTDTGGVDDKSFNQTAWKGVLDAAADFGIETKVLESQSEADYETNINSLIGENCDIIITVGFLLGDATKKAAEANPDQKFAIVDFAYDPALPNVLGLVFNTAEAAFLAGYVAAGTTQTGTIGTFGGINIGGPVTDFMDGYVWGARYYNSQNGTDVKVLGWDPEAKDGLFVGNFESKDDGRTMGQSLIDEGADIILPVAGPVGQGTAALAQERGDVGVIGVDTDWFVSIPTYKEVYVTSVMKNMDVAVYNAIKEAMDGTFQGGLFVGTLENDGVGIAPFHDWDSKVPADVKAAVEDLKSQIIAGTLDIQQPPA